MTYSVSVQKIAYIQIATPEFLEQHPAWVLDNGQAALERLCSENGLQPLDIPAMEVVASIWNVAEDVPAPRRWWHRLLFLHPTHEVITHTEMPGIQDGADMYKLRFQQYVVQAPAELMDGIRDAWQRSRQTTFRIAEPTKEY